MPEVRVLVDLTCNGCGSELEGSMAKYVGTADLPGHLFVEPCETCLEAARGEAYEKALQEMENEK